MSREFSSLGERSLLPWGAPPCPFDAGLVLKETLTVRGLLVPDKEIVWFVFVRHSTL